MERRNFLFTLGLIPFVKSLELRFPEKKVISRESILKMWDVINDVYTDSMIEAYKYGSGGWWQLRWDPSLLNAIKKPCEGKQIIYKTKEKKLNDKKESNKKERR